MSLGVSPSLPLAASGDSSHPLARGCITLISAPPQPLRGLLPMYLSLKSPSAFLL